MLKIWFDTGTFGVPDKVTLYTGEEFRVNLFVKNYMLNVYKDEWFEEAFVKRIVKEVDKSEVQGLCVISPVLGSISIRDISAGAMTVIALAKATEYKGEQFVTYLGSCGDNCARLIEEIAREKDIMVFLSHFIKFSEDIEALCLNDGTMLHGFDEYFSKILELERKDYDPKWEV